MKPEEKLPEWSDGWVRDGLITASQREVILARHRGATGGTNRFLAILGAVGGALFVVGVSLVIKSNWEQIHDWVKIGGLLVLLGGSYALGWRLKMTPGGHSWLGDACLMVGAVLFLLGIALVSQIFHIDSRPPNGVLLWWIGVVALPWLTRAKGMQFVSLGAGLIWLLMELASDDSWIRLELTPVNARNDEYRLAAAAGFLGLAVLGWGLGLRKSRHAYFAGLHEKVGLLVICGALYFLGFTWTNHHWQWRAMPGVNPAALAALLTLFAAAAFWAWRNRSTELKYLGWSLVPLFVPLCAHLLGVDLLDAGWLWGGLACLALFIFNLGLIRAGLATGRESWINLGMAFIALNIVTRYFVLFGSMLEGGIFFIVSGLLVLGLGWYLERRRRGLVETVRREVTS